MIWCYGLKKITAIFNHNYRAAKCTILFVSEDNRTVQERHPALDNSVRHMSQCLWWWLCVTGSYRFLVITLRWVFIKPPLQVWYFLMESVNKSMTKILNLMIATFVFQITSHQWTLTITTSRCNNLLTCGSRCRRASPQSVPTARATKNCNSCW
jgi:hypothetical protein